MINLNARYPGGLDMHKKRMFFDIWCCAHKRKYQYKGTPRELRELETIKMCVAKESWWKFEDQKVNLKLRTLNHDTN